MKISGISTGELVMYFAMSILIMLFSTIQFVCLIRNIYLSSFEVDFKLTYFEIIQCNRFYYVLYNYIQLF